MEITELVNVEIAKILNIARSSYCNAFNNASKTLFDAIEYSVLNGGKRVRANLVVMCCDAFKVERNVSLKIASAIEMIHAYSLVHDDLPAMDNDDFRRGKPSCHKQFNEATAILVGDGLLSYAFEVLSSEYIDIPSINKCKLINLTAKMCGLDGMVHGQMIDMFGNLGNIESIENMLSLKTGKLITLSCIAPSCCTDIDKETTQLLYKLGSIVGLAFQLRDDILDVIGNKDKLGKTLGKDLSQNKTNLVSYMGLDNANLRLKGLSDEALYIANNIGSQILSEYVSNLSNREL